MPVFNDMADVEAWLRLQSDRAGAAVLFSLRAALRALPALGSATDYWASSPASERGVVQIAFKLARTAWASAISNDVSDDDFARLSAYASRLTPYSEQADLLLSLQTHDITASAEAAKACALGLSAAASSGVDAAAFAAKAVEAAVSAAARAPSAFRSNVAESENMLKACAADAALIEQGVSTEDLLSQRLWITPQPTWTIASWEALKLHIRLQYPDFVDQVVWYEQCLYPPSSRQRGIALQEEDKDRLELDTPTFNDQARRELGFSSVAEGGPAPFALNSPTRPATIQPVWRGGQLTLASGEPLYDWGTEQFQAALTALRKNLTGLADSLSGYSNYDRHLTAFLFEMAGWISDQGPSHALILQLGPAKATLDDRLKMVEREWPEFQSSRYRALLDQLGVVLQRCPAWRSVVNDMQQLTAKQVAEASSISQAMTAALEEEGGDLIDPAIPNALRRQSREPLADSAAAQQIRANDKLAGTSNLLKGLIGGRLESLQSTSKSRERVPEPLLRALGEGVAEGVSSQIKRSGDIVVRRIFEALARSATRIGLTFGGGRVSEFFSYLAHQFPPVFGWLDSILGWLQNF